MRGGMDGSESEDLSIEEVKQAFTSLSAADKQRLLAIAEGFCKGSEFEPQGLISEAMVRLLEGTRRCPRKHPFIAVFIRSMSSIKSAWYKSKWHTSTDGLEPDDTVEEPKTAAGDDVAITAAAARQAVDELLALLDDYPVEQEIALMRCEGVSPDDIRKQMKLTKTQYDSALKQTKRLATRKYPEGWHPCR